MRFLREFWAWWPLERHNHHKDEIGDGMQYLLTQDELDNLAPKQELFVRNNALTIAREAILHIANFACIHNKNVDHRSFYCDDCPCSPIADGRDYGTWKHICGLPKEYSQ